MNPPKLIRLLFAATVVAGVSAPMFGAYAASGVDVHDPGNGGFSVPNAQPPNRIEIRMGDTVNWTVYEGKHNITPKDQKQWGGPGSGDITPDSPLFSKQFKSAGDYFYFCSIHSSADDVGKSGVGMWGEVLVKDPTPPPPPPASSSTTTTTAISTTSTTRQLGATPPATTATAPTTPAHPGPTAPAPAPTTTTAKPEKDKKQKDETTTTSSTLPPPIDLPDSAIIPTLPGATPSTDPGASAPAPAGAAEGEAVALLKGKNNGGGAMKLLIVSGLGLGALGFGAAGYKYANRSSKYFPA